MSNSVRDMLQKGAPAFGPSFGFGCATLVELVGLLGFDFAYLDAEHGTISPRECEDLVRAADARNLPTIVRVGTSDPQVMLRYLDTGIAGIQLPHMRVREDAERAVRAVRFHPSGERGLAGGRWADFGLRDPLPQNVERANEDVLLISQIEDREALDNLDELLAVEGVDVWFVGPSDLSQALGYPGQQNQPLVRDTVARTIKRLRDQGKVVGTAGPNAEQVNYYLGLGVQYFTVSANQLFIGGARTFQANVKVPTNMESVEGT